MTAEVAVVGSTGRVGRAVCEHLGTRFTVVPVARQTGESLTALVERAVQDADVSVNAAGVAHIEHPSADDLHRLHEGNIELPLALAKASLAAGVPMIHISSAKAADAASRTAYASSKREADERLRDEFGAAFETAGLSLIIIRPRALLFPPLDAGNVSRLSFLSRWPGRLTPALPVPVLAPADFLESVEQFVELCVDRAAPSGETIKEYGRGEWGTLRDVRRAFTHPWID